MTGGLNVPRAPQGHPVLIQAGSSGAGQALAARIADVVFTAQNDRAEAKVFYDALKTQVAGFGRDPAGALVMPGVFPVVGRTEAEAREIFTELNSRIDTEQAFTVLSDRLGTDMSVYPLDAPVPELPETEHLKSRAALLIAMARRERLTLRELYHRVAAARGHLLLVGNPSQIADVLEDWFKRGRRRRLQCHAALLPRPIRCLRRAGRADPSNPRPVPHRLRWHDVARSSGAEICHFCRPGDRLGRKNVRNRT